MSPYDHHKPHAAWVHFNPFDFNEVMTTLLRLAFMWSVTSIRVDSHHRTHAPAPGNHWAFAVRLGGIDRGKALSDFAAVLQELLAPIFMVRVTVSAQWDFQGHLALVTQEGWG